MKKKVLVLMVIISCLLIAKAGGAMGNRPDYKTELKAKLKNIDVSDGVDREEAKILAQNYLISNNLENLLIVSKPRVENYKQDDVFWLVTFPTTKDVKSKQGLKWGSFLINKKTAEVKYIGEGPS